MLSRHANNSARLAGINVGAAARDEPRADFGLIGLAVMGQNLILNAADHGFTVVAFNRTVSKVPHFLENEAKGVYTCPTVTSGRELLSCLQENPSSALTQSKSSFTNSRNRE